MINGNGEIRRVGNTWHDLNSSFALLFVQQGGPSACVRCVACVRVVARIVSCRVVSCRNDKGETG